MKKLFVHSLAFFSFFLSFRTLFLGIMLCYAAVGRSAVGSGNIVIDEMTVDVRVDLKDGRPSRVKEVTTYVLKAMTEDEKALMFKHYDNDATTIGKTTGEKMYYMSADSESGLYSGSVSYSGSRVCAMASEVKQGKTTKVSFERNYVKPAHFVGVMPAELYDIHKLTVNIHIPSGLTTDYKITEYNMSDGAKGAYTGKGNERLYTITVGQFIVQAKVYEDSNVDVQCVHRLRHHSVALQAWPMLCDICDTASKFGDASIVLTRN